MGQEDARGQVTMADAAAEELAGRETSVLDDRLKGIVFGEIGAVFPFVDGRGGIAESIGHFLHLQALLESPAFKHLCKIRAEIESSERELNHRRNVSEPRHLRNVLHSLSNTQIDAVRRSLPNASCLLFFT